jgi:putative alpha-1,2-mannosidase
LAAMGFYPLNPISGEYLLCSPIFKQVSINLPGGKILLIRTHKKSTGAIYINAVKWNGRMYSKNYINYKSLIKGGTLDIYLQDASCKSWASKPEDQPNGL